MEWDFPAQAYTVCPAKEKKIVLEWCPYEAKMKHVFTISHSSRHPSIVLTRITYDGYTGYGEAAMPPYLGETTSSAVEFLKKAKPELERFPTILS